jgi:hypothetical protein
VESFAVVGDDIDVNYAAQRWRFAAAPVSANLLYQPNPVTIGQLAARAPLRSWSRCLFARARDSHLTTSEDLNTELVE